MTQSYDIEPSDNGKIFALICHASPLLGLPLWVIPMLTRDDEFALFHAKQAGLVFIGFFVTFVFVFVASFVTCGVGAIAFPLVLLWYVPALLGFIDAVNGRCTELPVIGEYAEVVFGGVVLKKAEAVEAVEVAEE